MFTYLFTIVSYDIIKTYQELLYIDWDVKTVTAADYSVEFKLGKGTHKYW